MIALGNATDRRISDYGIPSPLPGPRVNMPAVASGGMLALGVAWRRSACLACIVVKFRRATDDQAADRLVRVRVRGHRDRAGDRRDHEPA